MARSRAICARASSSRTLRCPSRAARAARVAVPLAPALAPLRPPPPPLHGRCSPERWTTQRRDRQARRARCPQLKRECWRFRQAVAKAVARVCASVRTCCVWCGWVEGWVFAETFSLRLSPFLFHPLSFSLSFCVLSLALQTHMHIFAGTGSGMVKPKKLSLAEQRMQEVQAAKGSAGGKTQGKVSFGGPGAGTNVCSVH